MKLPNVFGSKGLAPLDMQTDASRTTTIVPSRETSQHRPEKEAGSGSSKTSSVHDTSAPHPETGEKIVETTPVKEAEALDKLSDEIVYPTGSKLAIITLALCLSVFLVALVRMPSTLLPRFIAPLMH